MVKIDLVFILLYCMYINVVAEVRELTPSTYYGCPKDSATFICVLNDTTMKWTWTSSNGQKTVRIYRVGSPAITQVLTGVPGVTTTLREIGVNSIITSLQFIFSLMHINARIECAGTVGDRAVVTVLAETTAPPTPVNFTLVRSSNLTSYTVITLQWDAFARSNLQYSISTAILGQAGTTKQTRSYSIDITLQYNMIYMIVLEASNCVGRSGETTLRLKFVQCQKPSSPIGVIIFPYSSTSEGSVITYQCMEGLMPNEIIQTTCGENSQWEPDPMTMRCTSDEAFPVLLVASVSATVFIVIFLLSLLIVVVLLLRNRYRKRQSIPVVRSSSTKSYITNASAKQTVKQVHEKQIYDASSPSYQEGPFFEDNEIYEEVQLEPDIWTPKDEWAVDPLYENQTFSSFRVQ